MPKHAVKFISGKYQGGEFPIPDEGELLIGRANDLDMVLVEDMVSRRHAKLTSAGGRVTVSDLGSTNGTYVNGEKIKNRDLELGDRILVGTSILKLIDGATLSLSAEDMADAASLRRMLDQLAHRAPATSSMSGELEEVPLPDLLLLFGTNKKTGVLTVGGGTRHGRVYLKDGELLCAVMGNDSSMLPMKVLCRMLTWTQGNFHFEASDDTLKVPKLLSGATENLLIEAMRQNDEIRRFMRELPALEASLRLRVPLRPLLADLSSGELETLQLVINYGAFRAVVDKATGTDHATLTHVKKLLKAGYVEVEASAPQGENAQPGDDPL